MTEESLPPQKKKKIGLLLLRERERAFESEGKQARRAQRMGGTHAAAAILVFSSPPCFDFFLPANPTPQHAFTALGGRVDEYQGRCGGGEWRGMMTLF